MLPSALIVSVQTAEIDLLEPFRLLRGRKPIYDNMPTEPVSPGVTFLCAA
jgi:hypothetical protein